MKFLNKLNNISPIVVEMGRRIKEEDNAYISLFGGMNDYYLHFGDKKFLINTLHKVCTETWMTKEEVEYLCKCASPIIKEMNEQIEIGTRKAMEAHWSEVLFGERE
jgi:hypothetical protein